MSSFMTLHGNEWDRDLLQDIMNTDEADLISSIPFSKDREDSWYWEGDIRGIYSVKNGYRYLTGEIPTQYDLEPTFWKKLWQINFPQAQKPPLACRKRVSCQHRPPYRVDMWKSKIYVSDVIVRKKP